jgi:transmembrane sensor
VAGLAAACVLILVAHSQSPGTLYTTRTAETHTVKFPDGSRAQLNTRTQLECPTDGCERQVLLHEGEAYFEVKSDVDRPFQVGVDGSDIRATGSRFDVYHRPNGHIRVTVLDGSVLVQGRPSRSHPPWHRELFANQQIEYGPDGLIQDTATLSKAADAVQWRDGVLTFENVPLPEVVEELCRYTDRRIVIEDKRLAPIRIVGVVSTHDVAATLRRIEKYAPVSVTEEGETYRLKYRD